MAQGICRWFVSHGGGAASYCDWRSLHEGYEPVYGDAFSVSLPDSGGGYHLPTEVQWEIAARGVTDRVWPWGDTLYPEINLSVYHANLDGSEDGFEGLAPVGSYPTGVSVTGCLDMAGNVWEWCHDWSGASWQTGLSNPVGPAEGDWKTLRGGSFANSGNSSRCSNRECSPWQLATGRDGFRCARQGEVDHE